MRTWRWPATRRSLNVVARTDVTEVGEIRRRAAAFAEAGADAVLIDGIKDLSLIGELARKIDKAFVFNQIAGGKSPSYGFHELKGAGISMVIYSTPCLFAAQSAIENAIRSIKGNHGHLPENGEGEVTIKNCNAILEDNLRRRDDGVSIFSGQQGSPSGRKSKAASTGRNRRRNPRP
jgi:2-methylisocitrate lyase-like PEP mutase family enzyme